MRDVRRRAQFCRPPRHLQSVAVMESNERQGAAMPLCFIEPHDAIRVIAESIGREARRQLVGELVRAWVDEIPDCELAAHYAKAIADLDDHDLAMRAAWHAAPEGGHH